MTRVVLAILLLILLLLLIPGAATYSRVSRRRGQGASWEDAGTDLIVSPTYAQHLLTAVRDGSGPRYEVCLSCWGLDREGVDQGWSWIVWDGDQALRSAAFGEGEDPLAEVGMLKPYMFGEEPTREAAVLKAVEWVSRQGAHSFLFSPQAAGAGGSLGDKGDDQSQGPA